MTEVKPVCRKAGPRNILQAIREQLNQKKSQASGQHLNNNTAGMSEIWEGGRTPPTPDFGRSVHPASSGGGEWQIIPTNN